ncbi:MAG: phosphopantothenate/pantothenate synthetase [Thermoplasmata archaeon]|nr:phosphopantothenate/pantothenate synthetase [Thermoplasmata archaeon]
MTEISPSHPRYRSLRTRQLLAEAARDGVVVPEGLLAHGRAEAFDYFLGERTTPSAARAERTAAAWLFHARHPIVSVNGNVAALAAPQIAALAAALPKLRVEVNLFHRTPGRAERIARLLRSAGISPVLGVHPDVRLPGLPSDRAWVDRRGIARADVCLVPLEDGDRTQALRARGVRVISIDLNPMSRTSRTADLPIIDELGRALARIDREVRRPPRSTPVRFVPFDRATALSSAVRAMELRLRRAAKGGSGRVRVVGRPVRGTERPNRRAGGTKRSRRRSPHR